MTRDSASALETAFHEDVARGDLAGFVALAWRPNQPTKSVVIGRRDVDRDSRVTRDTIFRIASATTWSAIATFHALA